MLGFIELLLPYSGWTRPCCASNVASLFSLDWAMQIRHDPPDGIVDPNVRLRQGASRKCHHDRSTLPASRELAGRGIPASSLSVLFECQLGQAWVASVCLPRLHEALSRLSHRPPSTRNPARVRATIDGLT